MGPGRLDTGAPGAPWPTGLPFVGRQPQSASRATIWIRSHRPAWVPVGRDRRGSRPRPMRMPSPVSSSRSVMCPTRGARSSRRAGDDSAFDTSSIPRSRRSVRGVPCPPDRRGLPGRSQRRRRGERCASPRPPRGRAPARRRRRRRLAPNPPARGSPPIPAASRVRTRALASKAARRARAAKCRRSMSPSVKKISRSPGSSVTTAESRSAGPKPMRAARVEPRATLRTCTGGR